MNYPLLWCMELTPYLAYKMLELVMDQECRKQYGKTPIWKIGQPIYEGETSLLIAMSKKKYDSNAIKILIEQEGLDVNEANERGVTPLIRAADYRDVELMRYLLDNGADVNAQCFDFTGEPEDTALMRAARYNHADAAKLLLRYGARIDIRNRYNRTAIDIARNNKAHNVILLFQK